jgi:hypothetical protein
MKKWLALAIVLSACPPSFAADQGGQQVRKLHLKRDDIAVVRTSVGIATLIQVPDRPSSVVLGDTNAFKVEYLENAITIKPLSHSSKSNLYIYTDARRFNVSLVTVTQPQADYIVYLDAEPLKPDPSRERWRSFKVEKSAGRLTVTCSRVGVSGEFLLLDFQIRSSETMAISPDWFWLTQNRKTVPIQGLNLSDVKLAKNTAIQAYASVHRREVKAGKPILFEVRAPSPITIELPEVSSWMK